MIIVHVSMPVKPEAREAALDLARRMTKASLAEPGCLAYDFYIGLRDPNMLMIFQEWESMSLLMNHFNTPHMEEFLEELPQVIAGEVTTRRYAVHNIEDEAREEAEDSENKVIH